MAEIHHPPFPNHFDDEVDDDLPADEPPLDLEAEAMKHVSLDRIQEIRAEQDETLDYLLRLEEELRDDPHNVEHLAHTAEVALMIYTQTQEEQYRAAAETYSVRMTEQEPRNPFGHYLRGKSLLDHDPDVALGHLTQAFVISQDEYIALEIADLHDELREASLSPGIEKEHREKSLSWIRRTADVAKDPAVIFECAGLTEKLESHDEAVELYHTAYHRSRHKMKRTNDPEISRVFTEVSLRLASHYQHIGMEERSEEFLTAALTHHLRDRDVLDMYGYPTD